MRPFAGLCLALGLVAACGKKASVPAGPPPEITGLAAVPATAEVVVGADVGKLAASPLIDRAVEQLLLRDDALADRWKHLKESCKLDVGTQIKRVMLAMGPPDTGKPGTGPVIMVVVGAIPEADLKDCIGKVVGTGGGSVTGKVVQDRTLYLAKDGNRTMYFGYGRPDTVVLGSSESYVSEALGTGKKASDNPELGRWLKLAHQDASLWAAGRVDARVASGLMQVVGKLTAGPVAFAATADLADGAKLSLGAVMATQQDAKTLESYVKGELALLTAAAQWKSLGPTVGKVKVTVDNDIVYFQAPLTTDDLNLLLSALDGTGSAAQDPAPPSTGSGSGAK